MLLKENPITLLIIEGYQGSLNSIKLNNTTVVSSLAEALKIISENSNIDVVITDTELKDYNGFFIVKKIREIYEGVLITVVDARNCSCGVCSISNGADDFILREDLNDENIRNLMEVCLSRRKFNLKLQESNRQLSLLKC